MLSEDYFFCVPSGTRVETENGVMNITDIVNNRYAGKVKSLDSSGEFVWKNIVNWWVRPNEGKKWVRVDTDSDNNTKAKLKCTDDHKVACFSDILNPVLEYTEAKNLAGRYMVRNPGMRENSLYSREQLSVLVGTLLGDGHISPTGQLQIVHSIKQKEYLNLKAEILNGSITKDRPNTGFGDGEKCVSMYAPINAQTKYLRSKFYNETGTKTVSAILDLIDEKALAFWYLDDGNYQRGSGMQIATYSFSYDEHVLLQDMFKNKWGIDCKIDLITRSYDPDRQKVAYSKEPDRVYYRLRFGVSASDKIAELIAKYVPDCMKYKLPEKYQTVEQHTFDNKPLGFSATKVKEVVYQPKLISRLYDIEVEDTHNFVANGTVVHNCQEVRKAGGKVWLCPWMKLEHQGSHVYGGSLMDIAQLGVSATADPELLRKQREQGRNERP